MFSPRLEFWTPARTRLLLRLLAALQLLGILARQIAIAQSGHPVLDGDFPTFYIGAWLAHFHPAQLYDTELNKILQNHLWPAMSGRSAPFIYPPIYALLLRPLTFLGANSARLLFVTFHLLCFLASCRLLQQLAARETAGRKITFLDLVCLVFLFAPMTAGIFGCQNSAYSLLLFVLILSLSRSGTARADFLAGLACGFWLFKPQYPALIGFGMVCAKRWDFVFGALVGAAIMYFGSAVQAGWNWPVLWLSTVKQVQTIELYNNTYQYCSIGGVLTAAAVAFGELKFVPPIQILAGALFIAGAVWTGLQFCRAGKLAPSAAAGEKTFRFLILLGPLLLLLSPHSHFYDLVLCIPAGLFWLPTQTDRDFTKIAGLFIFVLYFSSHRQDLAVSPLFLAAVLAALIGVKKVRETPDLEQSGSN